MLHLLLNTLALGKHHQPRGVAVEPVHDKELVLGVLRLHIIAQYAVCRTRLDAVGRHREQTVALVDNQDIFVLVDQPQTIVLEHAEPGLEIDFQLVTGMQHRVELSHGHIVHRHLTMGQIRLDRRAALVAEQREQVVEQRIVVLDLEALDIFVGKTAAGPFVGRLTHRISFFAISSCKIVQSHRKDKQTLSFIRTYGSLRFDRFQVRPTLPSLFQAPVSIDS